MVPLVNTPPFLIIVVDGVFFHAWPAWSNGDMQGLSVVSTVVCHVCPVVKRYSLLDANPSLLDVKPSFFEVLSTDT